MNHTNQTKFKKTETIHKFKKKDNTCILTVLHTFGFDIFSYESFMNII